MSESWVSKAKQIHWGLILIVFSPVIICTGAMIYSFTPDKQAQDKAWEENYNVITLKISKMDCSQLQQLRFDYIRDTPIPDGYGNHIDTIRDTYNALACGNQWYWWEG